MEVLEGQLPAQVYLYAGNDSEMITVRQPCQGHFLFIFVQSGIFRALIDGKKISCTSNELVIALCRHYYEVIRYNKKTACYFVKVQWQFITDIKMSGQFIELLVNKQSIKVFPEVFDSKILTRIMKLLHYYYQSLQDPARFPMASFKAALSLLVFQAAWQQDMILGIKEVAYSRKEMLAMQFLRSLIQHYRQERRIDFYARQLFVTKGYLNKAVVEATGKTVLKCIAEVLISEAKYLLMSSGNSIEAVSEQLHFNSAGSFGRFFKKETALSPTEYRKYYRG